ncbi:MAG TPA: CPBP family intramembrane glutamic endopeptidase [Clostridia bacterium]|nr:CPBP family intramembrane glutamic endopeptidase [Clostridia bacterium]
MRLLLSVFACVYAGSLLVMAMYCAQKGGLQRLGAYSVIGLALACIGLTVYQLRHPWQVDGVMRRLMITMGWFYGAILLGAWAQKLVGAPGPSVGQMVIGSLSFQGAAVFLAVPFVREHDITWQEAFGFTNSGSRALLLGVMIGCIFLPLGWGLQWLSGEIMVHLPQLQLKPREQEVVHTVQMASNWSQWVVLGVITILLAPAGEEILFRGILYPWLRKTGYRRLALWSTALIFGAIHFNLVTFVPLTVLALALALLYERTENLLAPIAAHSVFNAVNFAQLYFIQKTVG